MTSAQMPPHTSEAAPANEIDALRLRASTALRQGRADEAEGLLRQLVAQHPQLAQAHVELSSLLCTAGRADEAITHLDTMIARYPGTIWPLSIKAGVLASERRAAECLPIQEQLIDLAPEVAVLWMNYGYTLKTLGHAEQAAAAYRQCLRLSPGNGGAWWGLANLRTERFTADDLRAMEQALQHAHDPLQESQLRFALGKALADHGRYEHSFHQYCLANAKRGVVAPYDPALTNDLVTSHETRLPARSFQARPSAGHTSNAPIFIVGMPRSGSTLVEQILSSHPRIEGCGELFELQEIVASMTRNGSTPLADTIAALDCSELKALAERYLHSVQRHRRQACPRFIDKMPANWRYVALILRILPNASIVDVRRNFLPCCHSIFSTYFNRQTSIPTNLPDLGRYYHDYVRMMAHADSCFPGKIHQLHYEQLVENPEPEIRRLLAYLGLDFHPSCLRFHENPRPVHTPSAQQVRLPLNRLGLDRWRHFEPWLSAQLGPHPAPSAA